MVCAKFCAQYAVQMSSKSQGLLEEQKQLFISSKSVHYIPAFHERRRTIQNTVLRGLSWHAHALRGHVWGQISKTAGIRFCYHRLLHTPLLAEGFQ